MDRVRVDGDEPPVGPGDIYVEQEAPTRDERRAETMNRREYDRETGFLPTRDQAAKDHAGHIKRPQGFP